MTFDSQMTDELTTANCKDIERVCSMQYILYTIYLYFILNLL